MKILPIILILSLILPIASASIEITSELNSEYSLGDSIPFSLKITLKETVDALVKLTLKCTNKETLYYLTPISLEENKEISIEAPTIKAFSEGLCTIRINIDSIEGSNLEGATSKEFTVSSKLELSFTVDKEEFLPGDEIKIKGVVSKKGGEVKDGSIVIKMDNIRKELKLKDEFNYEIQLDENIESGEHTIIVEVEDSYGNYNEEGKTISVKAIPTKLEFELNKDEFKPKETLKLTINLLDQADNPIYKDINAKLYKEKTLFKDEVIIFDKSIPSNKEFEFTFEHDIPPKDYTLTSNFGDLEKEETIEILPNPEIETRLDGDIVYIKNIGNVEYNEKTTIMLEKDDKTYLIDKRIKLDVGEETTIDLSKEVPSGSYTVTLPEETEEVIEEETPIEEKVPIEKEEEKVIENVEIEDNRPPVKKGLSAITGAFAAGAGLMIKNPKSATFIMIAILLSIIGYFNRGKIEKVIEKIREKRENN